MFCYYRIWTTIFFFPATNDFLSLFQVSANISLPFLQPLPTDSLNFSSLHLLPHSKANATYLGFYHIHATLLGHNFSISYLIIRNNTHVSHGSVTWLYPITHFYWFCLGSFTCLNLAVELAEICVKLE